MIRMVLTDAQWEKMTPHCLGKPTDAGRSGKNNRLFLEAVLWKSRTGAPWRDLPRAFGNWIIDDMNERGAKIVISQRPQRLKPLQIDEEMYKCRHLIENFFGKLKEFKDIAMRSAKTDRNFASIIQLCSAVLNSKWFSTNLRVTTYKFCR